MVLVGVVGAMDPAHRHQEIIINSKWMVMVVGYQRIPEPLVNHHKISATAIGLEMAIPNSSNIRRCMIKMTNTIIRDKTNAIKTAADPRNIQPQPQGNVKNVSIAMNAMIAANVVVAINVMTIINVTTIIAAINVVTIGIAIVTASMAIVLTKNTPMTMAKTVLCLVLKRNPRKKCSPKMKNYRRGRS